MTTITQTFTVYNDTVISTLTPDVEVQASIALCVEKMRRLTVRVTTVRMSMQFVWNGLTYMVVYYPRTATPIA